MLTAQIPDCKFAKTDFTTAAERRTMPGVLNVMLFHKCMKIALKSVRKMDQQPVEMVDSYGDVHRERHFMAGYIGDLKEHKMIGCLNNDDCDKCMAEKKDLGKAHACAPRTQQSILNKIHEVQRDNPDASLWEFVQAAKAERLFGVEKPFWEDLPHVDICEAICTDVLHGPGAQRSSESVSGCLFRCCFCRNYKSCMSRIGFHLHSTMEKHYNKELGKYGEI